MSLNAYFTYSVCLGMGILAHGARWVFLSGVLFVLLTVTRIREQIVNGIPDGLKHSTAPASACSSRSWTAQRKAGGRQSGDVCQPWQPCSKEVIAACFGIVLTSS